MELQEQIDSLTTEKNNYLGIITKINNERVALDQMLVNGIKEIHQLKTEILVKDSSIKDLNAQIQGLLQEKTDLQNTVHVMQASAQSGG